MSRGPTVTPTRHLSAGIVKLGQVEPVYLLSPQQSSLLARLLQKRLQRANTPNDHEKLRCMIITRLPTVCSSQVVVVVLRGTFRLKCDLDAGGAREAEVLVQVRVVVVWVQGLTDAHALCTHAAQEDAMWPRQRGNAL